MKIANSSITMASNHREASYSYKESMTIDAPKSQDVAGAILTLSAEATGKSMKETMIEYQKQQKEEEKERQKENAAHLAQQMADAMREANEAKQRQGSQFEVSDEYDMKIKMLKRMLAALRGEKVPEDCKEKPEAGSKVLDLRSATFKKREEGYFDLRAAGIIKLDKNGDNGKLSAPARGTTGRATTWQKITATSGFVAESESTTFASTGIVRTTDGRSLDFNIEVSMSRSFASRFDSLETKEYIKTDPLIINLDTNVGSVSDQKFYFDLDSDGKEEQISFAGKGSGFLALDKNGDGKINDGSELFGTKSGDGFKDLAGYDKDHNGWIDENDDIFSKLRVWTKNENGEDLLMDLKDADIGAIYLGNADTQFSLKDEENHLNGEIKKTGIYLHESSGAVGTLNHVDLAI